MLYSEITPEEGLAHALALRKRAWHPEMKLFSEYWISRALFQSQLYHISFNGFQAVALQPHSTETIGVLNATLGCLNLISEKYPSFQFNKNILQTLQRIKNKTESIEDTLGETLTRITLQFIQNEKKIENILNLFSQKNAWYYFTEGIIYSSHKQHKKAYQAFKIFLGIKKIPTHLKNLKDYARLSFVFTALELQQYPEAIRTLKNIDKESNLLGKTLNTLAWAFLLSRHYQAAIGTTIAIQKGEIGRTFLPETPMIMSIAFNELCQYPHSLRAIEIFKKNYIPTYLWLKKWDKDKAKLYPLVVQFIKKSQQKDKSENTNLIPFPIVSEWIRSPLFLASQEEINLIERENIAIQKISQNSHHLKLKKLKELLTLAQQTRKNYLLTKQKGDEIDSSLKKDLSLLQINVIHYYRFRQAAPIWKKMTTHFIEQSKRKENHLLTNIEKHLKKITLDMIKQLNWIAENTQLIKVEIFNGGSHDLIWNNVHPDYEENAEETHRQSKKTSQKNVWHWGEAMTHLDSTDEIWEDELDSFKAEIFDNCQEKEKAKNRSLTMKGPQS